jgi:hypothetical protein
MWAYDIDSEEYALRLDELARVGFKLDSGRAS